MKSISYSIRFIVTSTIIAMGILGLCLTMVSSEIYRNNAVKNHKATIEKLVDISSNRLLLELTDQARKMGSSHQQEPAFKTALKNNDHAALEESLNTQFHRVFVTAKILNLEKIILLNKEFSFLSETTEGNTILNWQDIECPGLFERARQAKGADRLKTKSGICNHNEKTYHIVILPVGGLILKGYMMIITDPVNNLKTIENDIGMPVKLIYNNETVVYKSQNWDEVSNSNDYIIADYHLKNSNDSVSLHIEIIENIAPFYNKLPNTRIVIMAITSIVTFIAIFTAIIIINITTLNPLNRITNLLSLIRNDKKRLSDKIEVTGTYEVRQLAISFNEMTSEMEELHDKMEEMAYTDQLTNLPNRHLFNEKLQKIISHQQFKKKGFAVLMMDLNKFKPINDTFGHKAGDKILCEVGRRLKSVLRTNDSILRIDNIQAADEEYKDENTIARLGGDEFTAIIANITDRETAKIVAEKITLAMQQPFEIENHQLDVGICIGIALYPQDSRDPSDLLHKADIAMYIAKENTNYYAFYNE
jgi:GGDEF domain-containing protein